MKKDSLFTNDNYSNSDFNFNKDVASVFDDMINRSVPCFSEIHNLILDFCFTHFDSLKLKILDLGCSNGSFLNFLQQHKLKNKHIDYVGLDQSIEMLDTLHSLYSGNDMLSIKTQCGCLGDDESFPVSDAILLNLVLQFIPIKKRLEILKQVYKSLSDNGILFFVEKIKFSNEKMQNDSRNIYHNFKSKNGYLPEEILNKEKALRNVLIPLTLTENIKLLKNSGFSEVHTFFQWMNFVGFIAKK